MTDVSAFVALLQQRIGLDVDSIGVAAIARAVDARRASYELADTDEYWRRLQQNEPELQALIERVIVSETWFFRDPGAFTALGREALERWRRTLIGSLRLLSLPCATGEEPYSMAITLLEAGIPSAGFTIDAVDVSERAVQHAQRGWYGKNSFRGAQLAFRGRYFEPAQGGHQLSADISSLVRFQCANLFSAELLPGSELYDVIFCRNLLIYLDAEARQRAFAILGRWLKRSGLLFVGPAETALLAAAGFASARLPLAFAFRKQTSAPPAQTSLLGMLAPRTAVAPAARVEPTRVPPSGPVRASARPERASRPAPVESDLEQAFRLADQGRLQEATELCHETLRRTGPCARAYHLLGLVSEAAGRNLEAGSYHRKALYLEPQYGEALLHLALLLERQGDAAGAQQLRERARRSEQSRDQ